MWLNTVNGQCKHCPPVSVWVLGQIQRYLSRSYSARWSNTKVYRHYDCYKPGCCWSLHCLVYSGTLLLTDSNGKITTGTKHYTQHMHSSVVTGTGCVLVTGIAAVPHVEPANMTRAAYTCGTLSHKLDTDNPVSSCYTIAQAVSRQTGILHSTFIIQTYTELIQITGHYHKKHNTQLHTQEHTVKHRGTVQDTDWQLLHISFTNVHSNNRTQLTW